MTGIPCVHACTAFNQTNQEIYDHVDEYYSVESYKKTYQHVIMPIPDKSHWVNTNSDPVGPPHIKIAPGRPKKVRRNDPDEDLHSKKLSKKGIPIHCHHCGHMDHNARTCKNTGCLFVMKKKARDTQANQEGVIEATVEVQEPSNVPSGRRNRGTNSRGGGRISGTNARGGNRNGGTTTNGRGNGRGKGRSKERGKNGPLCGIGLWNGVGISNAKSFTPHD